MKGPNIGLHLIRIRRLRMWTQGRLAEEAGVSPTTVSGIETGRIARPSLRHPAKAGAGTGPGSSDAPLFFRRTLRARRPAFPVTAVGAVSGEREFRAGDRRCFVGRAKGASRGTRKGAGASPKLYGEFPEGSEQRRFIKGQIRDVSAQSGSISTSMIFHSDQDVKTMQKNRRHLGSLYAKIEDHGTSEGTKFPS
jgi:hypothetical protein